MNPNIMWNTILFYDHSGGGIECLPVFFGLEFKVDFDDSLKMYAFKVLISILLKCINSDLAIVFVIEGDLQSG